MKLKGTYSDFMNNREKGHVICKQFAIRQRAIRQVVNKSRTKEVPKWILVEHLKWFLSKKSVDHLIPPFVFGILKNLVRDLQVFRYTIMAQFWD